MSGSAAVVSDEVSEPDEDDENRTNVNCNKDATENETLTRFVPSLSSLSSKYLIFN
ncbi:unnamed protein product [Gongylonema pulchrum]|uniref:CTNNB1_binding domain-containing protein n=1 Tax=Gongylonema pulchrum TaxID=637853 RepID=A0A183D7N8_9BILA|nr:unnamed protein product [Gongylonema pulchrum]